MGLFKNTYDLGRVEVGFIIFVVIALIGVGLFAWNTGRDDQSDISNFAECVDAGNPIMESYPEQCVANGQTFINPDHLEQQDSLVDRSNSYQVDELGVEFEVDDELAGLYHYVDPTRPSGVYFSLESLRDTDCAADKTSLAALSRMTEEEVESDELLNAARNEMISLGDYLYLVQGAQASCGEDAEAVEVATNARENIISSIKQSLQTIQ